MGDKFMRPALSHQRQNPAKLLLVDSDDVGNSVEVLFSQHLFWHLWQQHSVNHGGQERIGLGKRAEYCLCFPFQVTPASPSGREEGGGFGMGNTCIPVADSF